MAQQDTGMGWSAKSEWLTQYSGQMATIKIATGGDFFPGQPIPVLENPSAADVVNNGYYIGETTSYYNEKQRYYVASDSTMFVYCFVAAQYGPSVFIEGLSDNSAGTMYVVVEFNGNYYLHTITAYTPVSGTTLYRFDDGSGYDARKGYTLNCPYYNYETSSSSNFNAAAQAAASHITIAESPVSKDENGYSVACKVTWKTSNGTELTSPILISSNTAYVDMTGPGGYNLAKFNKLLQGVRFYMGFWDIPSSANVTSPLPSLDLTDRGNIDLEQLFMIIISTNNAHVIIINSPDPYSEEGGGSGEEGGDGEETEDDGMGITHHAIPAAINTGFCRIYCPSEQQLRDLSNFLWSSQFDITAVKKLFANPMDSVLGLSAVPLTLSGANSPVYLGGVNTEMSLPMVSYQSYQVPMGAITVKERWGSYLDYDPYTKFSIYLPFIGFKDLSADDIMGKQIILDYDVDILSGACTARLQAGTNVLYQWSGQCSIQLPVTASNWNQVFQNATSAALSAGLAVATGSAGPTLAGALAAEGVQAIMGKPRIERGGTASGASGWMGGLTPYLVRVTPETIIPNDQNKFIGYPAFSSISLGALNGYNEISSIHLEGIPATGAELEELESILKGGVIF